MDIGLLSINMSQASLQNAVSISVMKMALNSENSNANQSVELVSNMAVDSNRGMNIDIKV